VSPPGAHKSELAAIGTPQEDVEIWHKATESAMSYTKTSLSGVVPPGTATDERTVNQVPLQISSDATAGYQGLFSPSREARASAEQFGLMTLPRADRLEENGNTVAEPSGTPPAAPYAPAKSPREDAPSHKAGSSTTKDPVRRMELLYDVFEDLGLIAGAQSKRTRAANYCTSSEHVNAFTSGRSTLSIPVPIVDHKEPFLTLRQLATWHNQVTDHAYTNAQGTHAAISTLMRDEANRACLANGPRSMRHFNRIVTHNLLLNYAPSHARDDVLRQAFTHHFRQCFEVTAGKEERQLHETIFSRRRKAGEPLYGFAVEFCTSVLNYNEVSSVTIQPPNAAHWLILGLNLANYPMLELHMQIIANWPNLPTPTQLEKQLAQIPFPSTADICNLERNHIVSRSRVA
jgi:hypothetical protein